MMEHEQVVCLAVALGSVGILALGGFYLVKHVLSWVHTPTAGMILVRVGGQKGLVASTHKTLLVVPVIHRLTQVSCAPVTVSQIESELGYKVTLNVQVDLARIGTGMIALSPRLNGQISHTCNDFFPVLVRDALRVSLHEMLAERHQHLGGDLAHRMEIKLERDVERMGLEILSLTVEPLDLGLEILSLMEKAHVTSSDIRP